MPSDQHRQAPAVESYRDRRRAAVVREIKDAALVRLAEDGPEGLALRAVARDLGLSVQSLYHYFASRDELITALVEDGHNGLADALEAARDALPAGERRARLAATSMAYRDWALAHRSEFQLIYGTPIAGYQAPPHAPAAMPPAARIGAVFQTVVFAGWTPEQLASVPDDHLDVPLRARTEASEQKFARPGDTLPAPALQRFLRWWGQLHGLVTLELFGHLRWVGEDAGWLYRATVWQLVDEVDEASDEAARRAARSAARSGHGVALVSRDASKATP